MPRTCYVTGKENVGDYSFGDTVFLKLTQDTFAHFILRAGRDPAHQKIMDRLKSNYERSVDLLDRFESVKYSSDEDEVIALQLEASDLDSEKMGLLSEKAKSGVRILRQMKAEFKSEGRLNT